MTANYQNQKFEKMVETLQEQSQKYIDTPPTTTIEFLNRRDESKLIIILLSFLANKHSEK